MPKYLLILSLLLPLATGCEREAGDDTAGQQPVVFTAHTGGEDATRAGVIDDSNLSSMGVFACYTGQSSWSESTSKSNFMYNQPVNKTGDTWTYTPVKYWPNTEGDKLSFFAYAPYADDADANFTLRPYGYYNGATGYPKLVYEILQDASKHVDLLFSKPLMNQTKGSKLSFTMGHALTHVLFKVKSTSAIRITRVQVNEGQYMGYIQFNESGYSWVSFEDRVKNYYTTTPVDVSANTLTDVGEFFFLPSNAKSVSLTFSEGGIEQPVTTVALPASPVWGMNKTVAYTLNIENKTKVTLSVKSWVTGSVSANLGEEVSGTYPFMKNGILYESATKYYVVGSETLASNPFTGTYTYDGAVDLCKTRYSIGGYASKEWRLPNIDELVRIRTCGGVPSYSTYWSISSIDANNAYCISGNNSPGSNTKSTYCRVVCVRDVGEITPPTLRQVDGFNVLYRNSSNVYMETLDQTFVGGYSAANNFCNNLTTGGYTDWRLPTIDEYVAMYDYGISWSTCWSSTSYKNGTHATFSGGAVNREVDDATGYARTYCVRDY